MAEARLIHVGFNFSGPPKVKELEPVFNYATDWLRYAPNCWILWTTSPLDVWYARLKPCLGPGDEVIIYRIDPKERHGWAQKWIWEWLDKKR